MSPIPSTSSHMPSQPAAGEPRRAHADGGLRVIFLAGALAMLVAFGASAVLSVQALTGMEIPGCGVGSPCARAAASAWGTIPVVDWPVSFVGLAAFAGLLGAWLKNRGRVGPLFGMLAATGGLISVAFIQEMLRKDMVCAWCLAAHVANLAFVVLATAAMLRLKARGQLHRGMLSRGVPTFAVLAMLATGITLAAEAQTRRAVQAREARELAASVEAMTRQPASTPTGAASPAAQPAAPTAQTTAPGASPAPELALPGSPAPAGFTGRYRWGPEKAAIRIVMFTGYQCADCRRMETQAQALVASRSDVSLSIKHFPLTASCNPHMHGQSPHPNGCWAARAAEAAGILAGNDGFVRMSAWLFARGGAFTDAELVQGLRELGFEPQLFKTVMTGPRTLELVQRDVEEGFALGLRSTPMIFINGMELRGWRADQAALPKTVEQLAKANLPATGPENDRPPQARDKILDDWRLTLAQAWPARARQWPEGPANATVVVQVWGDYLERGTAELDRLLRPLVAARPNVRYEFRYYPVDQACNPTLPRTIVQGGCRAVRAVEAAGRLGGLKSYWAMHRWIMDNQGSFNDAALRAVAPSMGLQPDLLLLTMETPEVTQVLADETTQGGKLRIPSIPWVYVNGKLVENWFHREPTETAILEAILDEAPAYKQ